MEKDKEIDIRGYGHIVVDTNIIFSSLVKVNGLTRFILSSLKTADLEIVVPEELNSELIKHRETIARKAHTNVKVVDFFIDEIMDGIEEVGKGDYEPFLEKAKGLVNDETDAPFAALAIEFSPSIILTRNIKDYDVKGLEKEGVVVRVPEDMPATEHLKIIGLKSLGKKKGNFFKLLSELRFKEIEKE